MHESVATPVRILLISSWQTVNIGDVAHSPGALTAFRTFAPDAEVTLWAWGELDDRERAMFAQDFPDVRVVEDRLGDTNDLPDSIRELFDSCDVLVHGSAPCLVTDREIEAWRRHSSKPYGFFGVTFDPFPPHTYTLAEASTMVEAIRADLLSPEHREALSGASFVWCRDSLSLRFLQSQGLDANPLAFGPDATVMYQGVPGQSTDDLMAREGLDDGNFICVVPRLRYSPYHQMRGTEPTVEQRVKDLVNIVHATNDAAVLTELTVRWVRESGLPAIVVPEMSYAVELARDWFGDLPDDVRDKVRILPRFWSVDQASDLYRRATAVVSMECHSPLLALAVGTPAFYLRQPTDTVKGQMFADLGLGDQIHEVGPGAVAPVVSSLHELVADTTAHRRHTAQTRTRAHTTVQRMVASVLVAARSSTTTEEQRCISTAANPLV